MNLFDILSDDERIVVLSSKQDGIIVTWNQSLTLQSWEYKILGPYPGSWEENDVRVLMETPASFAEARIAAQEWLAGNAG